jgi:hypothetical protein
MRMLPYETSSGGTRADDKPDYIGMRGDKNKTDQCSLDARLFTYAISPAIRLLSSAMQVPVIWGVKCAFALDG